MLLAPVEPSAYFLAALTPYERAALARGSLYVGQVDDDYRLITENILGWWVGPLLGDLITEVAFDVWTKVYPPYPHGWA